MRFRSDDKLIFENYLKSRKLIKEESPAAGEENMEGIAEPEADEVHTHAPTADVEDDADRIVLRLKKIKETQGREAAKVELEKIRANPELHKRVTDAIIKMAKPEADEVHTHAPTADVGADVEDDADRIALRLKKIKETRGSDAARVELEKIRANPELLKRVADAIIKMAKPEFLEK